MRKILGIIILFLILANVCFVLGQVSNSELENTQTIQIVEKVGENFPINPETGELDFSNTDLPFMGQRIAQANYWMIIKAPWLKYVFGMIPQISWLFAINLLLMWIFLSIFVFILPRLIFSTYKALTFVGLAIWIICVESTIIAKIAESLAGITLLWWGNLIILAVLIAILIILNIVEKKRANFIAKKEEDKKVKKVAKESAKEEIGKEFSKTGRKMGKKEEEGVEEEASEEADIIKAMADEGEE